ncbi:MAG: DUF2027 domain-containing protein [Bacteroidaceae bacterium]|nr:DUF2027 domain-containing protein [Bacteroidaceae bacterium]
MKIGDKVRFLTETGGGVVKGFKKNDIVIVEDEEGFEIPMLISNCVAIETDSYNFEHKTMPKGEAGVSGNAASASVAKQEPTPVQPAPKKAEEPSAPMFIPERREGEKLNVYLAFLPVDIKQVSTTVMETYLVNDSNYWLHYTYSSIGSGSMKLRAQGVVEPNTKLFVEEFTREMYSELEHVNVQLLAYKQQKGFLHKPAVDVDVRIDTVKFYKLHAFTDTPFFEDPALMFDIVRDDVPVRPFLVREEVQRALRDKQREEERRMPKPARKESRFKRDDVVEIDLHISELLDNTNGMSNAEILDYQLETFRRALNSYAGKKGQKIVFIHGKGDGALRAALRKELDRKTDHYVYQDASFQKYGFGAMLVIVK